MPRLLVRSLNETHVSWIISRIPSSINLSPYWPRFAWLHCRTCRNIQPNHMNQETQVVCQLHKWLLKVHYYLLLILWIPDWPNVEKNFTDSGMHGKIGLDDILCPGIQPLSCQMLCIERQVTMVSCLVTWTITQALSLYRWLVKPKTSSWRSMPSNRYLSQKFGGKPLTVASRQVEMNRIWFKRSLGLLWQSYRTIYIRQH
jgi:hypothetical protein